MFILYHFRGTKDWGKRLEGKGPVSPDKRRNQLYYIGHNRNWTTEDKHLC